jgi:DNA-binding GntR family transcriptional regulator
MRTAPSAVASSLAAEAYSIMRQRILSGQLRIGQGISRRKLARELGISFLPASEALIRLEYEGLLESRPRAGTRVRVPSADDVRGHFVVREALEVQAALLCARQATPAEKTQLLRLAARVDGLARQTGSPVYVELHQQLHRRIAECTRCAALCATVEQLHALTSMWFCAGNTTAGEGEPADRHQELVAAIASGERGRIEPMVREHVRFGLAHALTALHPYFRTRAANRVFTRA